MGTKNQNGDTANTISIICNIFRNPYSVCFSQIALNITIHSAFSFGVGLSYLKFSVLANLFTFKDNTFSDAVHTGNNAPVPNNAFNPC